MNDPIRRQLPYLRRFARALLGRQAPADKLVAAAIEAAIPSLDLTDPQQLRLQLYRSLVDAHLGGADEAGGRQTTTMTIADERIVASRVRSLPPEAAVAILLATLEGLSTEEIGQVMSLSRERAASRLTMAHKILESRTATAVLIIEDEPVIAMDIADIVRQAGHRVVGIAATHAEAVRLAAAEPPELILADIRLADDSSGISAVDEIRASRHVPAIFITAYPERLLEEHRIEPSILITKPFNDHLLRVAIAQALAIDPDGRPGEPSEGSTEPA